VWWQESAEKGAKRGALRKVVSAGGRRKKKQKRAPEYRENRDEEDLETNVKRRQDGRGVGGASTL